MIYLSNRKPLIRTELKVRERIFLHLRIDNYAGNMYSINKFDDFINVTDLDTLQKFLLVGIVLNKGAEALQAVLEDLTVLKVFCIIF